MSVATEKHDIKKRISILLHCYKVAEIWSLKEIYACVNGYRPLELGAAFAFETALGVHSYGHSFS